MSLDLFSFVSSGAHTHSQLWTLCDLEMMHHPCLLHPLLHANENLMSFCDVEPHYRVQCDATVIVHQLQQSHHY